MSCYLIKRDPDLSKQGVLIKRNIPNKGFSERTFKGGVPPSDKLKIGDTIYVTEKGYGIYAYGKITRVDDVKTFYSIEEIINHCIDCKIKDYAYWYENLTRFAIENFINELGPI